MKHATFPSAERPASVCLEYWPTVCRAAKPGFDRDFALSVAGQSRRRGWRPTDKQLKLMRRMVDDLFRLMRDDEGDDLALIE